MDSVASLTFDRFSLGVGGIGIGQFIRVALVVLRIHRKHVELSSSQSINAIMRCNGKQPCRERSFLIVTMQVLEGAQKRFLRGIFSQVRLAQHAITQVENRGLIGFDEMRKCLVTALLSLSDPGRFFVHACSLMDFLLYFTQEKGGSCTILDQQAGRLQSLMRVPASLRTEKLLPPPKRLSPLS